MAGQCSDSLRLVYQSPRLCSMPGSRTSSVKSGSESSIALICVFSSARSAFRSGTTLGVDLYKTVFCSRGGSKFFCSKSNFRMSINRVISFSLAVCGIPRKPSYSGHGLLLNLSLTFAVELLGHFDSRLARPNVTLNAEEKGETESGRMRSVVNLVDC